MKNWNYFLTVPLFYLNWNNHLFEYETNSLVLVCSGFHINTFEICIFFPKLNRSYWFKLIKKKINFDLTRNRKSILTCNHAQFLSTSSQSTSGHSTIRRTTVSRAAIGRATRCHVWWSTSGQTGREATIGNIYGLCGFVK